MQNSVLYFPNSLFVDDFAGVFWTNSFPNHELDNFANSKWIFEKSSLFQINALIHPFSFLKSVANFW